MMRKKMSAEKKLANRILASIVRLRSLEGDPNGLHDELLLIAAFASHNAREVANSNCISTKEYVGGGLASVVTEKFAKLYANQST